MSEYWYSRWLFERALAAIYLVAFIAAASQFVPLLGEHGLEPVGRWVAAGAVPRIAEPLLSRLPNDTVFRACAWLGIALSVFALSSIPQRMGAVASAAVWAALWLLYLSFVNIGQTFYAFGWETLLCEVGFFTIFAGASRMSPNLWLISNLAMDAVPPDVRRRPDQAARRCVLARSHVPELLLRNPADAEPAELVFPLDAAEHPHRRRGIQSLRRSDRAVCLFRAAAVRDRSPASSPSSSRALLIVSRQSVVAQLAHGRALHSAHQR